MNEHSSNQIPLDLDLTVVSRRPLRLPSRTLSILEALPVPESALSDSSEKLVATIVIVTYNNLPLTKLCLTSVLQDPASPPLEIIIVDNASTDGTPDFLKATAEVSGNIRLILNATNRGFAPANNQALAVARGDFLVLLNNDTVVPPGWLRRSLAHLSDHTIGLVGSVTNRIGNEAEVPVHYRSLAEYFANAAERAQTHAGKHIEIRTPCMFCVAMRRDLYERVGPLDERYKVGLFEDDDYAMETRAAGFRTVCADDVLIHHYGEASFGAIYGNGDHSSIFEKNKLRFEEKWRSPWQPPQRRLSPMYQEMKDRLAQDVSATTPAGARILVVSKGDDELLEAIRATGRSAFHFPQWADGTYAGCYPADDTAAVAQLRAASSSAEYIVFPDTSGWWLTTYPSLRAWLEEIARDVAAPAEHIICMIRRSCASEMGTVVGAIR